MDKKELLKRRKQAYSIFARSTGTERKLDMNVKKRIAREVGLTVAQIEKYIVKDKWYERYSKAVKEGKFDDEVKDGIKKKLNKPHDKASEKKELNKINDIMENCGINDQRKLFIAYYLQNYNISQAAMRAGYPKKSAYTRGSELLRDPQVAEVLNQIKAVMHETIFIRAHDVLEEYIKIAFSDITDVVEFKGDMIMLKDSTEIDGRLISEIKTSRNGEVTVKMHDKLKALDKVEKIFELLPDRKLELDREKFEWSKQLAEKEHESGGNVTIINDIG